MILQFIMLRIYDVMLSLILKREKPLAALKLSLSGFFLAISALRFGSRFFLLLKRAITHA